MIRETQVCLKPEEQVVGLLAVRIDKLSMDELKRLRYLLPKTEYRRLKDRKSARDNRRQKT